MTNLIAKLKWKSKVAKICKWSYKVSVGNAYLVACSRKYNQNVVINPTTIDTEKMHQPELEEFAVERNKGGEMASPLVIGWTGTHSTLQYLQPIIPLLQQLKKKHAFVFMVISNKNPDYVLRSFRFVTWNKKTEIEDLKKMDIGIMPLTDDEWSKGKCGFKLLQYMALKKPALASPVGVNAEIIKDGINGYLCNSEADWYTYLEELLVNSKQRLTFGKEGRDKVIHHYSVTSNQDNFLSLFE